MGNFVCKKWACCESDGTRNQVLGTSEAEAEEMARMQARKSGHLTPRNFEDGDVNIRVARISDNRPRTPTNRGLPSLAEMNSAANVERLQSGLSLEGYTRTQDGFYFPNDSHAAAEELSARQVSRSIAPSMNNSAAQDLAESCYHSEVIDRSWEGDSLRMESSAVAKPAKLLTHEDYADTLDIDRKLSSPALERSYWTTQPEILKSGTSAPAPSLKSQSTTRL